MTKILLCTVILTDVRIHLIIIQRYSILAISMKHLGLPKCIVSKLTCFFKMYSGICQNNNKDVIGNYMIKEKNSPLPPLLKSRIRKVD